MTTILKFGVWAPSQAVFWKSWIEAGICTEPGKLAPGFAGQLDTTADSWPGIIVKTPAVTEGMPPKIITPAVLVPGWHCNVRVFGAQLLQQFTAGMPTDGTIWQRTRAAQVFKLTKRPADPETGFPAGMRSPQGVTYADASHFKSPSNVWA